MKTKHGAVLGLLVAALTLSGCSMPSLGGSSGSAANVAVMKSTDSGATYAAKSKITDKQSVTAEVLSMLIDASNADHMLIGTKTDGIYATTDAGETWKKAEYPPIKVYGLAQDPLRTTTVYATGEWQGRGKVYRSDDSGAKWKEVYTEPADGTVVTALVHHPFRSDIVLAGLSSGVVVRTDDGGATWSNVGTLPGAVTQFVFGLSPSAERVYAVVQGRGAAYSKDGGHTFETMPVKVTPKEQSGVAGALPAIVDNVTVTSLAADPHASSTVYAGTEKSGILKSTDGGDTWSEVNVIASTKKYPVRSLVISPFSSDEIMYSSALAVYRSTNGGANWSTYQIDTQRMAGVIRYDRTKQGVIYLGFRTF